MDFQMGFLPIRRSLKITVIVFIIFSSQSAINKNRQMLPHKASKKSLQKH